MPKRPSFGGKAGVYRAWDGKLTGSDAGEPAPPPERNQTWGSVQRKQSGNPLYTLAEVEEMVNKAVKEALMTQNAAVAEAKAPAPAPAKEEVEEDIIIRGQ
jgi:hypothetical protein